MCKSWQSTGHLLTSGHQSDEVTDKGFIVILLSEPYLAGLRLLVTNRVSLVKTHCAHLE